MYMHFALFAEISIPSMKHVYTYIFHTIMKFTCIIPRIHLYENFKKITRTNLKEHVDNIRTWNGRLVAVATLSYTPHTS